ncbi:MAG: hypothetical protein JWN43_2262 [Gammaproteobacteria bacterium]|nr:hypothetical protein [Gammaproteobacteria bacterium]
MREKECDKVGISGCRSRRSRPAPPRTACCAHGFTGGSVQAADFRDGLRASISTQLVAGKVSGNAQRYQRATGQHIPRHDPITACREASIAMLLLCTIENEQAEHCGADLLRVVMGDGVPVVKPVGIQGA